MLSWVGKLLGSDKAASSLIDNVSKGLDKIYYSEEEKAEDKAEAKKEASALLIKWLEATQGSNLARRLIALTVTGIWASQYVASMLMFAVIPWVDVTSTVEALNASAVSLQESGEQIDGAMMLVLGFYFAAPHLGTIVTSAMDKFSGKSKTNQDK
jgi:hypothetical protein